MSNDVDETKPGTPSTADPNKPPAADALRATDAVGEPLDAFPTLEEWAQLKQQAAKAEEHWDRLVRLTADFDNYKKRMARDRQEAVRFANESLLERMILSIDNLEMALAAANQPGATLDSLRTGLAMVQNQIQTLLADAGLAIIPAAGLPFDPSVHEAVSQTDTLDLPEGHVVQQVRKGYKLHDRLLRPASVVVARKPSA